MDFVSVISILVVAYIRPQEWIGFVAGLKPVQVTAALALLTMVFRRRGFAWRDLLQTPHDWIMLLLLLWMVLSHADPYENFQGCNSLFIVYVVTVQALSNIRRIQTYLGWWTFLIFLVAALAVASEYGFDPMYSSDVSHGLMDGRLVLNLSIFNNPNALGHSVFPVVFMLYFLCFWKRPVFMKLATIPVAMLPLLCVYMTASKGAFVALFATLILALSFGRPLAVQLLVLVAAMTVGWTLLWTMPRMKELSEARTDQAIQGRVAAFQFGLSVLKSDLNGLGKGQFSRAFHERFRFGKAPHSSYVGIGAELGLPGFFAFIGIIYMCLRTLWQVKTRDETEERVRRVLFAMLTSYAVSSWMVDFAYRGSFFLIVAAVAAFHRQMLAPQATEAPQPQEDEMGLLEPAPAALGSRSLASAVRYASPVLLQRESLALSATLPPAPGGDSAEKSLPPVLDWNRIRWTDWLLMGVLTFLAVWFWSFIINYM